jgi:hypothetical protein
MWMTWNSSPPSRHLEVERLGYALVFESFHFGWLGVGEAHAARWSFAPPPLGIATRLRRRVARQGGASGFKRPWPKHVLTSSRAAPGGNDSGGEVRAWQGSQAQTHLAV